MLLVVWTHGGTAIRQERVRKWCPEVGIHLHPQQAYPELPDVPLTPREADERRVAARPSPPRSDLLGARRVGCTGHYRSLRLVLDIVGREQAGGTCALIRAAPPIVTGKLNVNNAIAFRKSNFIVFIDVVVIQGNRTVRRSRGSLRGRGRRSWRCRRCWRCCRRWRRRRRWRCRRRRWSRWSRWRSWRRRCSGWFWRNGLLL